MVNLSIIILSYNTKDLTLSCLQSLIEQYREELKNGAVEIIVVDNASTDGSIQAIQISKFKAQSYLSTLSSRPKGNSKLKIVQNEENLGFAKGCNIGARVARGKYVLFLNSDTQVLDRGLLKMMEFLDASSSIGILGGKLLNPDGSPQASCGKFYTLFNLFLMLIGAQVFLGIRKSPNTISKVDWVSGGCMMVKKSLFEKLSGFDENFFMYIEDMELCYRADKLGFLTYFYPDIKVVHKTLGSSNRRFAIIHIYKGILYFYSKHKNYLQYIMAKALLKIKAKTAIILGILTGDSSLIKTYSSAIKL